MNRYLVFACDNYYPAGGWDDFVGDFEDKAAAFAAAKKAKRDWWQVIDSTTKEEVYE
jgi:hypothetical protein